MTAPLQFLPGQGMFYPYSVPHICVVGEEFNKGVITWPEGTIFDYTAGGCRLLLINRHPTAREKDAFSGPARFALFCTYDLIFVSLQVRRYALAGRPVFLVLAGTRRNSSRS